MVDVVKGNKERHITLTLQEPCWFAFAQNQIIFPFKHRFPNIKGEKVLGAFQIMHSYKETAVYKVSAVYRAS